MPLKPYFENAGITLYHGDCREVLRELQSETFDLILTDPPYLVSYAGRWGSDWGIIQRDSDPMWVAPAFIECWRVLKPDSLCISFYGWPHTDTFVTTWKLVGFRPVSVLVLVKDRLGLGQFTRAQHEQAYVLAKGQPTKPETAISDVLRSETTTPLLHPNQKPLGAFSKLVATYSPEHGLILDPFCGSGTILVAARKFGRRANRNRNRRMLLRSSRDEALSGDPRFQRNLSSRSSSRPAARERSCGKLIPLSAARPSLQSGRLGKGLHPVPECS